MNILVLLAGVADNRYPLHDIRIDAVGLIEEGGKSRRQLGPFDEGVLELALKLRDAREDCRIEVLVLGGSNNDNLLRSVAAFKPDHLRLLDLQPCRPWDARLSAAQIAGLIGAEGTPDLLLIGREFGDLDEGSLPVLLAARLGLPLFALAQYAEWQDGRVRLLRERGIRQQWHAVAGPLLATVTNDRRNKLRHPLMKNVMLAKKMTFDSVTASAAEDSSVRLADLAPAREVQRGGQCRLLDGDVPSQARVLAGYLRGEAEENAA